jgi:hypothetical protein
MRARLPATRTVCLHRRCCPGGRQGVARRRSGLRMRAAQCQSAVRHRVSAHACVVLPPPPDVQWSRPHQDNLDDAGRAPRARLRPLTKVVGGGFGVGVFCHHCWRVRLRHGHKPCGGPQAGRGGVRHAQAAGDGCESGGNARMVCHAQCSAAHPPVHRHTSAQAPPASRIKLPPSRVCRMRGQHERTVALPADWAGTANCLCLGRCACGTCSRQADVESVTGPMNGRTDLQTQVTGQCRVRF